MVFPKPEKKGWFFESQAHKKKKHLFLDPKYSFETRTTILQGDNFLHDVNVASHQVAFL